MRVCFGLSDGEREPQTDVPHLAVASAARVSAEAPLHAPTMGAALKKVPESQLGRCVSAMNVERSAGVEA